MDSHSTELWTVPRQETKVARPAVDAQPDQAVQEGNREPRTLIRWVRPGTRWWGRHTLGMEFDGRRLTVVGIRGRGKRRRINRLYVVDWPETPSSDMLVRHLRAFVPRGNSIVRLVINSPRGIVRRFIIPRVPKHKRYAAALWQGKQLVPFPLDDKNACCGWEFTSADEQGWWVTLVAFPREDANTITEAISRLGWHLHQLSLAGTQLPVDTRQTRNKKQAAVEAIVFYSPQRSAFAVFEHGHLTFHYDLGPLPGSSSDPADWVLSARKRSSESWISSISPAINDAVDFYTSAHQGVVPSRLVIVGARETVAPVVGYVNEWERRFVDGVAVKDPLGRLVDGLPAKISRWIESNMGLLTHAAIANSNARLIDLTPAHTRKRQSQRRLVRYARTAFMLSVAGTIVTTGLLARQLQTNGRSVQLARVESRQMANSPSVAEVSASISELARYGAHFADVQKLPVKWMPWMKTVLGTIPANGQLSAVNVEIDDGDSQESSLLVRLEGTLAADGPPHAISYKEWVARLTPLTGDGRVTLARENTTTWKGRQRSNFTIELRPTINTITGARR